MHGQLAGPLILWYHLNMLVNWRLYGRVCIQSYIVFGGLDRLGYNEKYYFTPSDDSFKVWDTVRWTRREKKRGRRRRGAELRRCGLRAEDGCVFCP